MDDPFDPDGVDNAITTSSDHMLLPSCIEALSPYDGPYVFSMLSYSLHPCLEDAPFSRFALLINDSLFAKKQTAILHDLPAAAASVVNGHVAGSEAALLEGVIAPFLHSLASSQVVVPSNPLSSMEGDLTTTILCPSTAARHSGHPILPSGVPPEADAATGLRAAVDPSVFNFYAKAQLFRTLPDVATVLAGYTPAPRAAAQLGLNKAATGQAEAAHVATAIAGGVPPLPAPDSTLTVTTTLSDYLSDAENGRAAAAAAATAAAAGTRSSTASETRSLPAGVEDADDTAETELAMAAALGRSIRNLRRRRRDAHGIEWAPDAYAAAFTVQHILPLCVSAASAFTDELPSGVATYPSVTLVQDFLDLIVDCVIDICNRGLLSATEIEVFCVYNVACRLILAGTGDRTQIDTLANNWRPLVSLTSAGSVAELLAVAAAAAANPVSACSDPAVAAVAQAFGGVPGWTHADLASLATNPNGNLPFSQSMSGIGVCVDALLNLLHPNDEFTGGVQTYGNSTAGSRQARRRAALGRWTDDNVLPSRQTGALAAWQRSVSAASGPSSGAPLNYQRGLETEIGRLPAFGAMLAVSDITDVYPCEALPLPDAPVTTNKPSNIILPDLIYDSLIHIVSAALPSAVAAELSGAFSGPPTDDATKCTVVPDALARPVIDQGGHVISIMVDWRDRDCEIDPHINQTDALFNDLVGLLTDYPALLSPCIDLYNIGNHPDGSRAAPAICPRIMLPIAAPASDCHGFTLSTSLLRAGIRLLGALAPFVSSACLSGTILPVCDAFAADHPPAPEAMLTPPHGSHAAVVYAQAHGRFNEALANFTAAEASLNSTGMSGADVSSVARSSDEEWSVMPSTMPPIGVAGAGTGAGAGAGAGNVQGPSSFSLRAAAVGEHRTPMRRTALEAFASMCINQSQCLIAAKAQQTGQHVITSLMPHTRLTGLPLPPVISPEYLITRTPCPDCPDAPSGLAIQPDEYARSMCAVISRSAACARDGSDSFLLALLDTLPDMALVTPWNYRVNTIAPFFLEALYSHPSRLVRQHAMSNLGSMLAVLGPAAPGGPIPANNDRDIELEPSMITHSTPRIIMDAGATAESWQIVETLFATYCGLATHRTGDEVDITTDQGHQMCSIFLAATATEHGPADAPSAAYNVYDPSVVAGGAAAMARAWLTYTAKPSVVHNREPAPPKILVAAGAALPRVASAFPHARWLCWHALDFSVPATYTTNGQPLQALVPLPGIFFFLQTLVRNSSIPVQITAAEAFYGVSASVGALGRRFVLPTLMRIVSDQSQSVRLRLFNPATFWRVLSDMPPDTHCTIPTFLLDRIRNDRPFTIDQNTQSVEIDLSMEAEDNNHICVTADVDNLSDEESALETLDIIRACLHALEREGVIDASSARNVLQDQFMSSGAAALVAGREGGFDMDGRRPVDEGQILVATPATAVRTRDLCALTRPAADDELLIVDVIDATDDSSDDDFGYDDFALGVGHNHVIIPSTATRAALVGPYRCRAAILSALPPLIRAMPSIAESLVVVALACRTDDVAYIRNITGPRILASMLTSMAEAMHGHYVAEGTATVDWPAIRMAPESAAQLLATVIQQITATATDSDASAQFFLCTMSAVIAAGMPRLVPSEPRVISEMMAAWSMVLALARAANSCVRLSALRLILQARLSADLAAGLGLDDATDALLRRAKSDRCRDCKAVARRALRVRARRLRNAQTRIENALKRLAAR